MRARQFPAIGAAVIGLDLSPDIRDLYHWADFPGLVCDLTDAQALQQSLESGLRRVGELEMLVLNAGMFPEHGGAGRRALRPLFAKTTAGQVSVDGGNDGVI